MSVVGTSRCDVRAACSGGRTRGRRCRGQCVPPGARGRRGRSAASPGLWTFYTCDSVVHASSRSDAGQRPDPYQPGAMPQVAHQRQPQAPTARTIFRNRCMHDVRFISCQQTPFRCPNRGENGTRFQRFGIGCLSAQPAGLGWYEGQLWRCAMQKCRSAGPGNYARNVQTPVPTSRRHGSSKVPLPARCRPCAEIEPATRHTSRLSSRRSQRFLAPIKTTTVSNTSTVRMTASVLP